MRRRWRKGSGNASGNERPPEEEEERQQLRQRKYRAGSRGAGTGAACAACAGRGAADASRTGASSTCTRGAASIGAWLPQTGAGFAPLETIELAPHMLSDHRAFAYLEALKSCRRAARDERPAVGPVQRGRRHVRVLRLALHLGAAPVEGGGGRCCYRRTLHHLRLAAKSPLPALMPPPTTTPDESPRSSSSSKRSARDRTAEQRRSAAQQACARHHCRVWPSRLRRVLAVSEPQFGILKPARCCDTCFFRV